MKINLLLGNNDLRSGYINVDPLASGEDRQRYKADWTNLDDLCCAGEAQEIVALEVLNYLGRDAADKVLAHWVSRLGHGGTLTVSVIDPNRIARALISGELSEQDANGLLYGQQSQPWQCRKLAYSLATLSDKMRQLGLQVLKQVHHGYQCCVMAVRP